MDRDAIARAQRLRQANEALEFERDRTASLAEQIEEIVAEAEGPRVDEEAFARMTPEDAQAVRAILQPEGEPLEEEDWLGFTEDSGEADPDDAGDGPEEEIARLEAEIAESQRRREVLERYIEALGSTEAPTVEELESQWLAAEPAPRGVGAVRLICVRLGDGVHQMPERVEVTRDRGVEGDRWSLGERPDPEAQVTLMNVRVTELIAADGAPLDAPGDNFLVDLDLAEDALPAGTRLRLGTALLEVSPTPHTGCKKFRERFGLDALMWVNDHGDRRLRGMNCRVLEGGSVAIGDSVEVANP